MSYAAAAIATFANVLGTLDRLVGKAESHEKGEALLAARLAPDMFPLHAQIRYTIAQVLVPLDRLGTLGLTLDDSEITSFAEARTRIAAAQALVAAADHAAWPAAADTVEFDVPNGMTFVMQAHEYCRDWAVPQVYFHLMSAYSVLRTEGLAIGQIDDVGYMLQYAKQPAA